MKKHFIFFFLLFSPSLSRGEIKPTVEVSRSVFPSQIECRLAPWLSEDCPANCFTTLVMSYTVGSATPFEPSGRIETSFAYMYKNEYRTEPRYTIFAWPDLQVEDPSLANYGSFP